MTGSVTELISRQLLTSTQRLSRYLCEIEIPYHKDTELLNKDILVDQWLGLGLSLILAPNITC